MTPCIEWNGRRDKDGYGIDSVGGRAAGTNRAHRRAWIRARGPIPAGMCVCHSCDNPACVNVDHLWLGTVEENNKDKARKGRAWRLGRRDLAELTHCKHGHEFTPENTYIYRNKSGMHRGCKACGRVRSLAWYHANKGVAA